MNRLTPRSIWLRSACAVGIASVAVFGVWFLRSFEPNDASWHPKCIFHLWTGLHCPGCGTTRALRALALGNGWDAVQYNPLLVIGLPVFAYLVWRQNRRERHGESASPRLSLAIAAIVIGYFVLRNVPSPERGWLAPPSQQTTDIHVDNEPS